MSTDRTIDTTKLQPNGVSLSGSPDKAMQEMMKIIDDLRAVYIEETEALESADTMRFLNIQDKKMAVTRNYQIGRAHV